MLLIGSLALEKHVPLMRTPIDVDLIGTFEDLNFLTGALRKNHRVNSVPLSGNKTVLHCVSQETGRRMIVEYEIAWTGSAARQLLDDVYSPVGDGSSGIRRPPGGFQHRGIPGTNIAAAVATLDILYTLKMSHRFLKNSPHFRKTHDDIMYMREHGAKIFDAAWLKRREEETYTYKHPKLNVMKKDFFRGDGVEYVYDHDTIHVAMAHRRDSIGAAVPAYTLYMKDGEQVQTSKRKFFEEVPEQVRLWGVLEEAQVLALERSQIPFRGKVEPRRSFDMALMKVCTSITSGWFREFAWENLRRVEALYEPDYVDRFWKAVDDGIVRKLEPGEIATIAY